MSHAEPDFHFSISRNNVVLIAALEGNMNQGALAEIEHCKSEIEKNLDAKVIILDFSGVDTMEAEIIAPLANLQRMIRAKGLELRLSALSTEFSKILDKSGILRRPEMASNLREAIASVGSQIKSAAASSRV